MRTMQANNEVFQPANTHFTFLQMHVKTDERLPTVFPVHLGLGEHR